MKVGILGAGHIAAKMGRTLMEMSRSGAEDLKELCYCVASRDLAKAEEFAAQWGFSKAYGSYEEMVSDPDVDLVYVATPHSFHYPHVKMCLEHGRNVLCEKSFMLTLAQAEEIIALARSKGLLVAEAAWPRYTPFSWEIKKMLEDGILGEPQSMTASLCFPILHKERVAKSSLGGGALLDLGIYPLHFALMHFGSDIKNIQSQAVVSEGGVDLQESISLVYNDGRMAVLHASVTGGDCLEATINGTKACMVVDSVTNPCKATVYGRNRELIGEYTTPAQITGFEYEVLACKRAIEEHSCETRELPHSEMLTAMRIMDKLLADWGVKLG